MPNFPSIKYINMFNQFFLTAQLKCIPGLSDDVREVIVAPKLKVGTIWEDLEG